MSISFDSTGTMALCLYSGCWEGTGEARHSEPFLVLVGRDLAFSTASDPESSTADATLILDHSDSVAILKIGEFAQPLVCEQQE